MYTPDRWVMVKIEHQGETTYRVFGSWYGGYLDADKWRMNSGCTKITEAETSYTVEGRSGSVYVCRKNSYGLTAYGKGALDRLRLDALTFGASVEVLPEDTVFTALLMLK